MKFSRIFAVLTALLLCVSVLSACGGGKENDSVPQEQTAAGDPGGSNAAADPSQPAENDAAWKQAYRAIVEDVIAHPENYYDADSFSDLSMDRFGVADIDSDGEPELLIKFVSSFVASWHTQIWNYDAASDSAKEYFACASETEFYKTGYVKELGSHNQTNGSLWPYELSKLENGQLTAVCGVSSEEKELAGESFPEEQDTDGDGIIYYRSEAAERQPMTAEEYTAFEEEYVPGNQQISVDYYELTAESLNAVFG